MVTLKVFFRQNKQSVRDGHLRSSNDEAATRLEVVDGFVVQIFSRNHSIDHLIESMQHYTFNDSVSG